MPAAAPPAAEAPPDCKAGVEVEWDATKRKFCCESAGRGCVIQDMTGADPSHRVKFRKQFELRPGAGSLRLAPGSLAAFSAGTCLSVLLAALATVRLCTMGTSARARGTETYLPMREGTDEAERESASSRCRCGSARPRTASADREHARVVTGMAFCVAPSGGGARGRQWKFRARGCSLFLSPNIAACPPFRAWQTAQSSPHAAVFQPSSTYSDAGEAWCYHLPRSLVFSFCTVNVSTCPSARRRTASRFTSLRSRALWIAQMCSEQFG
ncbi:unnamed protein product [Prorocentrum cordatum]|uniref:Uncharacterized protein n=1 Tax=Prorocentrum cordatum TaxID=2364126 RepID=A0ABN9PKC5_9DINO|nr:unnamed protein product [Polarella glacialis]